MRYVCITITELENIEHARRSNRISTYILSFFESISARQWGQVPVCTGSKYVRVYKHNNNKLMKYLIGLTSCRSYKDRRTLNCLALDAADYLDYAIAFADC